MAAEMNPCMYDREGRRVERWIAEMQSREFLRASIARGERTEECWAVLRSNQRRIYAGRAAIAIARGSAQVQ